jgi:hypothetical protein
MTIEVCGLNRSELRELRGCHYSDIVIPHAHAINRAVLAADVPSVVRNFDRALGLLQPRNSHVGMTYDALCADAPDAPIKALIGVGWPAPNELAT